MRSRKLLWQLYPSYLVIIVLSLLVVAGYSTRVLHNVIVKQTATDLEYKARLVELDFIPLLETNDIETLSQRCKILGQTSKTRITLILMDGRVIADSDFNPEEMDNHLNRPEIQAAISEGVGSSARYSNTLLTKMMYVAISMEDRNGEKLAVIRTSTPMENLTHALWTFYWRVGVVLLLIMVLAAWLNWMNVRRISLPLETMRLGAERIARGDLSGKLPHSKTFEVNALADALNKMAEQLDDRIYTILRQRREQKAVFKSISDAVMAIDADGLLISINNAAAQILEVDRKAVRGRTVGEVLVNPDLKYFVSKTLDTTGETEDEIVLDADSDPRYLQARGRPLLDEEGKSMGAVVVLNDVTKLRRLEKARKDFVSNVSHELRTPITSVKGFVETLLEGALDSPEDSKRFIQIISRQADRLEAIIEDLLSLARIERDAESEGIDLNPESLKKVIDGVVLSVDRIAQSRNISIDIDSNEDIQAWINPPLLEQAIVNLVDNAIKYSGEGTTVVISTNRTEKNAIISVGDKGSGIDAEHLPRLFERFYRVDKGRSRNVGGTGLGLAIVKHISLAHGGHVEVDSEIGKGSVFSIHLPLEQPLQQQLRLDELH